MSIKCFDISGKKVDRTRTVGYPNTTGVQIDKQGKKLKIMKRVAGHTVVVAKAKVGKVFLIGTKEYRVTPDKNDSNLFWLNAVVNHDKLNEEFAS